VDWIIDSHWDNIYEERTTHAFPSQKMKEPPLGVGFRAVDGIVRASERAISDVHIKTGHCTWCQASSTNVATFVEHGRRLYLEYVKRKLEKSKLC